MRNALCTAIAALLLLTAGATRAEDKHAGYYYPEPQSIEEYEARAPQLPGSDRSVRLNFIAGIIQQIAEEPYPPTYAMFAKGENAEKLIIVGVRDGFYDTLYRARALLAALTSLSRATPLFHDLDPEQRFTFFDLCYMLGFEQLTISNGREFAHQVVFQSPSVSGAGSQ